MKDLQQTFDEYHAERFLIQWMNAHKPMQFIFSLVRKSKCWEVKRLKENRYLGTVELTSGKYHLEIFKRNGEWTTEQKSLIPVVKQPLTYGMANR